MRSSSWLYLDIANIEGISGVRQKRNRLRLWDWEGQSRGQEEQNKKKNLFDHFFSILEAEILAKRITRTQKSGVVGWGKEEMREVWGFRCRYPMKLEFLLVIYADNWWKFLLYRLFKCCYWIKNKVLSWLFA